MIVQDKFIKAIEEYGMLKKKDTVLAGVSGGPDSVALLMLLAEFKDRFSLKVHVVHFNHMLRKREAEKEERFVRVLAKNLGFSVTVRRGNAALKAKKDRLSLEDAARRLRYDFFFKIASKFKSDKIALGHTLDDQAETFIMRAVRGAGIRGLAGIWPVRKMKNCYIIRPLLKTTKKEVLEYLKKNKAGFCVDSSNLNTVYLRNEVRLKVIPYLMRRHNPQIKETLSKEAELLREGYQYISKEAQKVLKKLEKKSAGGLSIDLTKFKKIDVCLQTELLCQLISKVKGGLSRISFEHISNMKTLIGRERGTSELHLPGGIEVVKEYNFLKVFKRVRRKETAGGLPLKLKIPGRTKINSLGLVVEAEALDKSSFKPQKCKKTEFIDADKLKEKMLLRTRKSNDRFKPLGMKKNKSLKEFFIDAKIPRRAREKTLLLVSGHKIVWVAGHRLSEDFKVDKETKRVLKLKLGGLSF
ncbi:MAG: tRNA lysidine(34) synthetase TilS [Candidatus Omnitrophica bacterium]|nr:tRNA lysidine(34) synthetase TilS [Candidatus Omnitrophota bacterium]